MKFLIVSNGLGEDFIACNLIKSIKKKDPSSTIKVVPLVGEGVHYQKNYKSIKNFFYGHRKFFQKNTF